TTGSATPTVQMASLTVSVTPLAEPELAGEPAARDIRTITAGILNMRAEPNKYAELLASLPRGTRVTVSETSGTWAYVTAPDGTTGWLSQNFLAPTE
ncbi:MAG: SH3 domain-containing protein, partial [Alphaproteobacteria bacterium]